MNQSKLESTQSDLTALTNDHQKVLTYQADVSNESNVVDFIKYSIDNLGHINTLINNAGVYGPKGLAETIDSEEWIKTMNNNMFSVFYTCKHILPHMKLQQQGNIINLSGGGEQPFPRFTAYATSKAAVVKFTEVLAEEVKDFNIYVNSIAPGAMNTALLDEVLQSDPEIVGKDFFDRCVKQKESGGADPAVAAELCLYLVSEKGKRITGKLISAVWDDWAHMHENIEDLVGSRIYTMRRIV